MAKRKRKVDVPWTRAHLKLLGKMPDAEVAERTGRTANAVTTKRIRSGVAAFQGTIGYTWERWEVRLLGTASDYQVAEWLGISRRTVIRERHKRGIPAYRK